MGPPRKESLSFTSEIEEGFAQEPPCRAGTDAVSVSSSGSWVAEGAGLGSVPPVDVLCALGGGRCAGSRFLPLPEATSAGKGDAQEPCPLTRGCESAERVWNVCDTHACAFECSVYVSGGEAGKTPSRQQRMWGGQCVQMASVPLVSKPRGGAQGSRGAGRLPRLAPVFG